MTVRSTTAHRVTGCEIIVVQVKTVRQRYRETVSQSDRETEIQRYRETVRQSDRETKIEGDS